MEGTAFGGARGRTDVQKLWIGIWKKGTEIDPMITHTLGLKKLTKVSI